MGKLPMYYILKKKKNEVINFLQDPHFKKSKKSVLLSYV